MMESRKRAAEEQARLIEELRRTLGEVKTLRGFLPICSSCKKIRRDQGSWQQIESYIREHSDAEFSHGLCPECAKDALPGILGQDQGHVRGVIGVRVEPKASDAQGFGTVTGDDAIREIVRAHGGADLWRGLDAVEAVISAHGFLFTVKRRPILERVRMRASTRSRYSAFRLSTAGTDGRAHWNQGGAYHRAGGRVIAQRLDPRAAFHGLRRQYRWDDLDFIYFAGYATWNYLVTPFLFLRDGFAFRLLDPAPGDRPPPPACT